MKFDCPECGTLIAEEIETELLPLNKSKVTQTENEAPIIKCGHCGHILIIVKGTL